MFLGFFKIPKRYVVMIMIFLVSPISYGSRSLLSQTEEYFSDKIDTYNHSFTAAVDQCTHLTKSEEKIINIVRIIYSFYLKKKLIVFR